MSDGLEIAHAELRWLNGYRASELYGGLVLGRLALRVRDPQLMLNLTRHAGEEVRHAQRWTETILAVGGKPKPVRHTYQAFYRREIGPVSNVMQVLALTHVFEQRFYRHFMEHAQLPGTHPEVRTTLLCMVEEEAAHLSWVKTWLDQRAVDGRDVAGLMARYREVDQRIYDEITLDYGYPGNHEPSRQP